MTNIIKKSFAVLLIGFIFIINVTPISLAQVSFTNSCYPGDACPIGCQFTSNIKCSSGFVACNCSSEINTPASVNPGAECDKTENQINTEIGNLKCSNGSAIWDRANCKAICSCPSPTKDAPKCAANQSASWIPDFCDWKCIDRAGLQEIDLSKIGKTNTAYKAKVEIPCNTTIAGGECPKDWQSSLSGYITRLYQFGLMISGVVALGVIMYGAVLYTLSAGNVASKEEGKEWMKSAIYGVVLLFGAYLILYTIDPNLVKIGNPNISPVLLKEFEPEKIYVSDTNNNSVASSTGSAIPGCEISSSGALGLFDDFATVDVNGQQYLSTGKAGTFQCQKCLDSYTLKDGKCEPINTAPCKSPTAGPKCESCISGYVKYNNQCVKPVQTIGCASGYSSNGTLATCIPANLLPSNNIQF